MRSRSALRGYTIVEVLMSMTVMAIGVAGVIALQKVTISSNRHAKNLALATQIAQAWQDQLALDSAAWNEPGPLKPGASSDLSSTGVVWLNQVDTPDEWFLPTYDADRAFGAAFDALGAPLADADAGDAAFCAHVRLNWLVLDTAAPVGNGLIRTEVRVFWLRDGATPLASDKPICDTSIDPDTVGAAVDRFHFVYQASAVRQNPQ